MAGRKALARYASIVGTLLVSACSNAAAGSPATTVSLPPPPTATTTTTTPDTTTTTSAVSTSSVPTTEGITTTNAAPTSSTTTTTTAPPPTTTEPARSMRPSALPRPTGFARFEPAPALVGVAALTGLPADDAVTSRAALAVKIDNAVGGPPQWNLADADLVFEENVEGITRFVAVYQTNMPDRIGPVRSARTSDLDILASLNRPILAWSGGNLGVTLAVRGAHTYGWLSNLSAQSSGCFWRSRTRSAPHNLLLDPACARASATLAGPALPVFLHDAGGDVPGERDERFTVHMDGLNVTWVWDAGAQRFQRRQRGGWHVDADGDQVGAENVVVLFVDYRRSPADARSPEAVTVGTGRAALHRGGRTITGTWSRPDRFSPFLLFADDGRPLTLAPGTTFVELAR
jgi:hypothetical protein